MVKKVLFVWEHGGNLGHLTRLLPIAIALEEAGYEVVFSVADVLSARRYFGALSFSFVTLPRVVLLSKHESGALNHADILLKAGFGEAEQARRCIVQWLDVFKTIKPAAVLVDSSPLALYSAHSAGLPAMVIGHGFEIPPEGNIRPCFTPWIENAVDKANALENRLQKSFEALRLGLPAILRLNAPDSVDNLFRSDRVALCTWPELDHFDRNTLPTAASTVYTGPIWADAPTTALPSWSDADGPKVLCYLNLRDKRYDLLWQALKHHGANVLEISPDGVARACEAARGWGVQVIEQPALISHLISNCDAVVGHGGMGLTSMALHSGKSMLLLPEHLEQVILAYRLSKQGLATATIRLKEKILLQKKVGELLGAGSLKQQAELFAQRYCRFRPDHAVNSVASRLNVLAA